MPFEIPEMLKEYGGMFGRGLILQMVPEIGKGVLAGIFKAEGVNLQKATKWVQDNVNLWWDVFKPEYRDGLKELAQRGGGVDWLTADWVVEAIKHDFPLVASLFLGWKKAGNWLTRQVEIVKKEVYLDNRQNQL